LEQDSIREAVPLKMNYLTQVENVNIYIFGGRDGKGSFSNKVNVYDPETKQDLLFESKYKNPLLGPSMYFLLNNEKKN